jgi:hypothetical protein
MNIIFHEDGVAETVGALALIIVIGLGIAIAGVYLLSTPVPEKILNINVNFSYNGTYLIIHHNGGDTLQKDEFYLMVDGIPKHAYIISDGGTSWSVGKDIEMGPIPRPSNAQIIYEGSSGNKVLASADSIVFGMPSNGSILKKFV